MKTSNGILQLLQRKAEQKTKKKNYLTLSFQEVLSVYNKAFKDLEII